MLYCPICNNAVEDNATFCPHCGTQFAVDPQYTSEQQYSQQYDQQYSQQPSYQPPTAPKKRGGAKIAIIASVLAVIAIAVVAIFFLLPPSASSGLEFSSNNDGTCTWVGIGSCTDTKIVVPQTNEKGETVVSVASNTVDYSVEYVTEIVLPKTIKTIENAAFDRAENLTKITLNEGLETIKEDAFRGCEKLEDVSFPSTLKSIGEFAFAYCSKLTEIELPEGFNNLEKFAFSECYNVKKITIPSTLNKLHLISKHGGNCGLEFETESIEEINFAGEWKYVDLSFDAVEESDLEDVEFYYYGIIAQDVSNEEYPGFFKEITPENRDSVICAIFNKRTLKFNGKEISFNSKAPTGMYKVEGFGGFTIQEFTKDNKLNVSYEGWSESQNIKDVTSGSFEYHQDRNLFTYQASGTAMDSTVEIAKAFVNLGDFIFSMEYTNIDGDEDVNYFEWVPYSGIIKYYIEEDVEIEEEQLENLVEKKEDLLADLIDAFENEGIEVSVNQETGELALDSSVLFGGDSATLTDEGKQFLNRFLNVYTSVIFSEKYDGFISKTIIEGHTAPLKGSTYESGLPLSKERAENVKAYCTSSEIQIDTSKLASSLEAEGLSNSKPVYKSDGAVDLSASRRVSFRFLINLDQ